MNTIPLEEACRKGLPKWPKLLMSGKPVGVDIAKNIIFRTDRFLKEIGAAYGGNNRLWNAWARKELGYNLLQQDPDESDDWMPPMRDDIDIWALRQDFKEQMAMVDTNYVHNTWASSAFIFGPHGWMHPDGQIGHVDNVGKWPSVSEILKDLGKLQTAWPLLEMTATLFDGEGVEDAKPVVTLLVRPGHGIQATLEHEEHHYPMPTFKRSLDDLTVLLGTEPLHSGPGREQGLPDAWIEELGKVTKPIIERLIVDPKFNLEIE